MRFELTVLGTSSAIPTKTRNLSAQVLNVNDKLCLIDCADGTQLHLKRSGLKANRIGQIFISHLHGDHFYGLIGLLSSMQLLGREKEMKIFGPEGLEDFLKQQLKFSNSIIEYPLKFYVLQEGRKEMLLEEPDFTVESFPVKHRVPCWGFLFREKELPRNIKKSFIRKHNVPISIYKKIKNEAADFVDEDGTVYKNSDITIEPPHARSYAYTGDTIYNPEMTDFIHDVDLLYHEATFAEDKIKEANEKFHSTARQAAMIAKAARVKELLIGHFSARYKDISPLLTEAQTIFPSTRAAEDGVTYKISR